MTPHSLLGLEVVPYQFSFGVVFAFDEFTETEGVLELNLYDPNDELIAFPKVDFDGYKNDHRVDELVLSLKMSNVLFKQEGEYVFKLILNGENIGEHKFQVVKLREA